MPSRGNNQLPMKAPKMPTMRSPTIPKPVPCTICPASQPAMRPTSNITNRLSPDIFIEPPRVLLLRFWRDVRQTAIDPRYLRDQHHHMLRQSAGSACQADTRPIT